MERAVIQLVGAGLTSIMPGFGIAVPVGAIEHGLALTETLSRTDPTAAAGLLKRLAQTLQHDWRRSGLSQGVIDRHIAALPGLLERHRPSPALVQVALVAAQQPQQGGDPDVAPSRQLAADIVALTRKTGDVERSGLDETIVFMMLDRLFAALASESTSIDVVRPLCAAYLQQRGWLTAPSPNPTPPPLPPTARLKPATLAILRANVEMRRKQLPDVEAAAAKQAELLTQLIDGVAAGAARNAEAGRELAEAGKHLVDGAFAEADRALANAEHLYMQLAQTDLGTARDRLRTAAEMLEFRAALEEIRFEFRKAARHYRSALRCFSKLDVPRQWQCMMRHAQALLHHYEMEQDEAALTEAAKVYAQASRLHPEQVGPLAWAEGESRLAEFLINLGERQKSQHRFAEAIDHARAACGVLAVEQAGDAWLRSQTTLARALWLYGDLVGNAQVLGDAAVACRIVRDRMTRETNPAEWVAMTALLGQVLLRQATVAGLDTGFAEATENLRAALQFAETAKLPLNAADLEACLGRSLLAQFTNNDQPFLLDLAATAFRRAIKAAHANAAAAEKAGLQHELGMTLWVMAERAADRIALEAAAEALQSSAASLESLGDSQRAGEIRRDIVRLREAMPTE